jgi:hypothetical protein
MAPGTRRWEHGFACLCLWHLHGVQVGSGLVWFTFVGLIGMEAYPSRTDVPT